MALFTPPAVCFLLWSVWRRLFPDAAKLAAGRRSRAGSVALRALERRGEDSERIAATLLNYLRDRAGLPATAITPAEIAEALKPLDCPGLLAAATVAILHRCDAARFAPGPPGDASLAADAAKIVLEWEAAAWPAPGC